MTPEKALIIVVAALEYGAAVVYLCHGDIRHAIMWAAFATGSIAATPW